MADEPEPTDDEQVTAEPVPAEPAAVEPMAVEEPSPQPMTAAELPPEFIAVAPPDAVARQTAPVTDIRDAVLFSAAYFTTLAETRKSGT